MLLSMNNYFFTVQIHSDGLFLISQLNSKELVSIYGMVFHGLSKLNSALYHQHTCFPKKKKINSFHLMRT